jgi:hypothetical protein
MPRCVCQVMGSPALISASCHGLHHQLHEILHLVSVRLALRPAGCNLRRHRDPHRARCVGCLAETGRKWFQENRNPVFVNRWLELERLVGGCVPNRRHG